MSPAVAASTPLLLAAVERALRAPSVHNTQPWRWRVTADTVELHADPSRHLVATDPDQRDLVLSCGAALHHLRVALADAGVATTVARLPDPEVSTHLATVRPVPGDPNPRLVALAGSIEERHTDRRRFAAEPVDADTVAALRAEATANGVYLHVVTDPAALLRLEAAFAEAAGRQRYAPGYIAELTIWSRRYAGSRDGVPPEARTTTTSHSPGIGLRAFPEGNLPPGTQSAIDAHDGSLLCVLTTIDDTVGDRLLAGEAASAVLLAATRLRLATTPLSQATEVGAVREYLSSEVLHTPDQPQLGLRVGRPGGGTRELTPTPRRPLHSVLMHD
jgi:nitroreductase